jgi:putative transposase
VSLPPKRRRLGPPHNPGVRDLVEGKRHWSAPRKIEYLKRGFRGWHERGYLPHRDEPGLTQFVTFHLADSFPALLSSEWAHFAEVEDDRERRRLIEAYMDKGRGECHLRRPEIARLVEENFLNYSRDYRPQIRGHEHEGFSPEASRTSTTPVRYELRAWVIMPNHVHVLFKVGIVSIAEIIGAWKKHSGRLANQLLGRSGAFWAADYFDIFVRDDAHELQVIRYIEQNPTKAKLVLDPKDWSWSSLRYRNEFGVLKLP